MEIISKIFEFDFAVLVPDLTPLLERIPDIVRYAVLAGPALLLAIGLVYLLIPPKEANRRMGFRTYFGMGSVEAWRYTQKLAGLAFGVLGLVLLIVMLIVSAGFAGKDQQQMMELAAKCLIWQAALALVARLAVGVLAAVFFDRNGNRRRK